MKPIVDAVRGRTEAMLARIEELVTINSYTRNKPGGDAVGSLLVQGAEALGLVVRRIPSELYADHLVFSTKAAAQSAEGATVLVGHHDTVFPAGSFEGFVRDGELVRGPGVLDMKGGLVVMLEALRALREAGLLDALPLRMIVVGDEEIGSPEGRGVIQREAKGARAALVFEAGRAHDRVITARKGTGSAKLVARGVAAHAANDHDKGRNAIWALARFIDRAQRLTDYERGVTVNVGVVRGGHAKNTVPDHAECEIDFRFVHAVDGVATFEALREAASEASREVDGTTLELGGGPNRMPLERTPENLAVYEAYAACARAAGLGGEESALIAGGSDASSTASIGVPSIDGLGPRGAGFHTKEERVEIASLEPKVIALASYLAGSAR